MKEADVFYDRYGAPVLRELENGRLVNFMGQSVGFIKNFTLYNYSGQHVGWLEGGIIRDRNGNTVAFGERPIDYPHPFLPFRRFKPFPSHVQFEPFRPFVQQPWRKPFKSYGWSPISPISLFLGEDDG